MILRRIDAAGAGGRFDKYLFHLLPNAGRSFIYKMLRKKNITLNGSKASGSEILCPGDAVRLFFSDETFAAFTVGEGEAQRLLSAGFTHIDVIYEDDDVVILNKPAGILCQKSKKDDVSLNEELLGYLTKQGSITDDSLKVYTPSLVNRLDMNTSGAVIGAKTLAASRRLSGMLKSRLIGKYYLCAVEGTVTKRGILDGYLTKDKKTNTVSVTSHEIPGSSHIKTGYRRIGTEVDISLLEVELMTGKTHQIRAAFSSAGHPLLGDPKYGNGAYKGLKRQALHSYRVVFPAVEGELSQLSQREFVAPLPEDLRRIFGNVRE